MTPLLRAAGVTILFVAVGLWAALFHDVPREFALPHLIFYAVLTINTFFSVRFYASFAPSSAFQTIIDLSLAAAYIALALSIGLPLPFAFCALAIFTIAPAKYANLLAKTPYDATLRKKIVIDLFGTLMCAGVLGLTLFGFEVAGAWVLAILFSVANIYLLTIRPMYQHVQH